MLSQDFYDYLLHFEINEASPESLANFTKLVELNKVFEYMFETYINQRLKENFHSQYLLNLIRNLEKSEKTSHLSKLVNERLVVFMTINRECFDHFYYLYRNEFRKERNVLDALIENLGRTPQSRFEEMMQIIDLISPNIGIDKYSLILLIMESKGPGGKARRLLNSVVMGKLEVPDRYMVLVRAVEKHSSQVYDLQNALVAEFKVFVSNQFKTNKDQDVLALALQRCMLPITQLYNCTFLNEVLYHNAENIPHTLDYLYHRAESENLWEYLLLLGVNKNKKELLQSIVKSKSHRLIDKFFLLYKNYPEVKHLAPFL
jgi:hypothetical protein